MSSNKSVRLSALLSLAATGLAAIVATEPSPGSQFPAGGQCSTRWTPDTTGLWKSMSIDLMSGDNTNAVVVTSVAANVDGTIQPGQYTWTCPAVAPNAPIYFYRFKSSTDPTPVFTTRFTIAATNGSTSAAEHQTQPDGTAVPWGTGALLSGSVNSTTNATMSNATHAYPGETSAKQNPPLSCSKSSQCPEATPCCSEYGVCGIGRSCLAGCDPWGSFKPAACMPVPAFTETKNYTFTSSENILVNGSEWKGAVDKYDWILESSVAPSDDLVKDDKLSLTYDPTKRGMRLSSTRSLLYGNVTVRLAPSVGSDVVTSSLLLSGTRDEIDFDFSGNASQAINSSYFYRGETNFIAANQFINATNGTGMNEYTLSWTPTSLAWLVNGQVYRNTSASLTFKDGVPQFPNTPCRVMLSIWPASLLNSSSTALSRRWVWPWQTSPDAENKDSSPKALIESVYVVPYANATSSASPASATPTSISNSGLPIEWYSSLAASLATAAPTATSQQTGIYDQMTGGFAAATSHAGDLWDHFTGGMKLHKRQSSSQPSAYAYNVDPNGNLAVSGSSSPFTLAGPNDSGLSNSAASATMTAGPTPTSTGTAQSSHSSASSTSSATSQTSASSTSSPGSLVQAWNKLPTAAHVGIIIGCIAVALFIVVCCGWIWTRASGAVKSRKAGPAGQGLYKPLDSGALEPSEPYRPGALGHYDDTAAASSLARSKSTASSDAKFPGGFVPSSSSRRSSMPNIGARPDMTQYQPDYTPLSQQNQRSYV